MITYDLSLMGKNCQKFREEHGYYQLNVAFDLGYSVENISAFEHGRNDNARILLWYLGKGMTLSDLLKGVTGNV